jgi:ABC-type Fe2+-enterobactin transport system substrate-binding protein
MQTFGNNQCQCVVLSAGQIGLEKIMTRSARVGLAAALLLAELLLPWLKMVQPREDIQKRGGIPISMATATIITTTATIIAITATIIATTAITATKRSFDMTSFIA